MLQEKIEKLKILIQTSAILNDAERAEWLTLLGLMNDKQLLELERILTASQPDAVHTVPAVKPAVPAQSDKPASPGHLPQLSHIMNLPLTPDGKPAAQNFKHNDLLAKPAEKKPSMLVSKPAPKQPGAFLSKLRHIVDEKELPAGKSEKNMLPAHGTPDKPVQQAAPVRQPAPVKPAAPAKIAPQQAPKPLVPPVIVKPPVISKTKHQAPAASELRPEDQTRQGILESIKKHLEEKGQPDNIYIEEDRTFKNDWKVKGLEDLAQMSIQTLENNDAGIMAQKIKDLLHKHNYHEILFSLEKSQAYKSYLETGTELLRRQTDFEHMPESALNSRFNREQFERFADLLRFIQAA